LKKEYTQFYKGLPINTGNKDISTMDEEILEASRERFDEMRNRYSQCLLIRFDLHLPENITPNPLSENALVSEFFNQLIHKKLKRGGIGKTRHKNVAFFWVREVEKAKKAHYHCWIMVDRHIMQFAGSHRDKTGFYGIADEVWKRVTKGSHLQPASMNKNGLNIRLNYPQEAQEAFYAISYLAKRRGKQYGLPEKSLKPSGSQKHGRARNWGGNRLNKLTPPPSYKAA
jgi:hypothetical protein